jgi:hypothetical protein
MPVAGDGRYSPRVTTIVDLVRNGLLDAELASLLWLLAEARFPIHVASGTTTKIAEAVRGVAADPTTVTDGPGTSIDEVIRQPVPLRPPTGAIAIVDPAGRVSSAHLLRPPLRDGAGHVRPQGPAVLAARREADGQLEHFAWGILSELEATLDRKAGDVEADIDARATFLNGLVATGAADQAAVLSALQHWADRHRRAS